MFQAGWLTRITGESSYESFHIAFTPSEEERELKACHVERRTNLIGVSISMISGIDLGAVEEAAAENNLLEFKLTEKLAKQLQNQLCGVVTAPDPSGILSDPSYTKVEYNISSTSWCMPNVNRLNNGVFLFFVDA